MKRDIFETRTRTQSPNSSPPSIAAIYPRGITQKKIVIPRPKKSFDFVSCSRYPKPLLSRCQKHAIVFPNPDLSIMIKYPRGLNIPDSFLLIDNKRISEVNGAYRDYSKSKIKTKRWREFKFDIRLISVERGREMTRGTVIRLKTGGRAPGETGNSTGVEMDWCYPVISVPGQN